MTIWTAVLVAVASAVAGNGDPPAFTRKPTVSREGHALKVEFAVNRETDVAVTVEDAKGQVVRHLVAGCLGKNPPSPLSAGSLNQSVGWDGRDDFGKPAVGGPFNIRVALGLGAAFDKILLGGERQEGISGGPCLATGPDGTLYVVTTFGAGGPGWGGQKLIAVHRDGTYRKTLWPCPANLTKEQMAAWGATVMDLDGRPAPVVSTIKNQNFIEVGAPRKGGMTVTPDGVILMMSGGRRIAAVDANGIPPWGPRLGPALVADTPLLDGSRKTGRGDIAVSSDGKFAYVSGLKSVVYRVPLPARGPAERFFGESSSPGSDETHLGGAVRGVAVDGKGHLLVADYTNNRVVAVSEKDGTFAGSFSATSPDCIAVDRSTGRVYLTRVAGGALELVKLQSWKDPKELARLKMDLEGNRDYPPVMALDAAGTPPILWLSGDNASLLRIEDQGDKFSAPRRMNSATGDGAFVDISVDRFSPDPEIFVRGERYWWFRYSEKTGQFSRIQLPVGLNTGSTLVPGPDGLIYTVGWPYQLFRFDRNGTPLPWDSPNRGDVTIPESGGKKHVWKPTESYLPVSMTYMTHTLGVRYDGRLFALDPGAPGGRPPKMLVEYEPSGKRLDSPIVWKVSDLAVGPKFDPQGNIYIAEHLNPLGQPYPPEIQAAVGPMWEKRPENWQSDRRFMAGHLYGSILKFTPKGGMVHWTGVEDGTPRMNPFGANPFKGEPQLDPSLRKTEAQYFGSTGAVGRVAVTGAEWIRSGISHLEAFGCNCQNVRFDVDGFGRVWVPDLARFRVNVLDTNGNDVVHFGGYGNAESRGPEIAFAWLMGVGVTDRYAYMGDSMNRRFLRAKLVYAAEATCPVP